MSEIGLGIFCESLLVCLIDKHLLEDSNLSNFTDCSDHVVFFLGGLS